MSHPLSPLFDLRLRTPNLELRIPTDDDLVELCEVARRGVHDQDYMPFTEPWTRRPSPQFEREFARWFWRCRVEASPERWHLNLVAFFDGRPIGTQDLEAVDFLRRRVVETGSWLGKEFQGKGLGKEMRAAVLQLAFAVFDADVAYSEARPDNVASIGVSRALGYAEDGMGRTVFDGEPHDTIRFRLTREHWNRARSVNVMVEGAEGCLDLLGLAGDSPPH